MERRSIRIDFSTAKEWYFGDNSTLKNLALQAFTKAELEKVNFDEIYSAVRDDSRGTSIIDVPNNLFSEIFSYCKLRILAEYFNKSNYTPKIGELKYFIERLPVKEGYRSSWYKVRKHESVCYPGLVYFEKEQSAYNALNVIIDNNIEI